jgi:hypothetical protein
MSKLKERVSDLDDQLKHITETMCPVQAMRLNTIVRDYKSIIADQQKELDKWKVDFPESTERSGREL